MLSHRPGNRIIYCVIKFSLIIYVLFLEEFELPVGLSALSSLQKQTYVKYLRFGNSYNPLRLLQRTRDGVFCEFIQKSIAFSLRAQFLKTTEQTPQSQSVSQSASIPPKSTYYSMRNPPLDSYHSDGAAQRIFAYLLN